jgi:chemotaxis protein MotB
MSGGGDDPFTVEEEHENHERYLITYADMITLLMALFVILYAMGTMANPDQFNSFAQGARDEVIHPLDGGIGVFQFGASEQPPDPIPFARRNPPVEVDASTATELARELGAIGVDVWSTVDDRGVVLTVPDDALLFGPGSADLLDPGRQVIARIGAVLNGTTNPLVVEGHTDSQPMAGESNWDLSSVRASTVVEQLIAAGIDPRRLRAEGFADTRPVADNSTEEGRRRNRRVEVVVSVSFDRAGPDPIDLRPVTS